MNKSVVRLGVIHNKYVCSLNRTCSYIHDTSHPCKEETKTCYVYENATDTQICLSVHDTAESAALDTHYACICTYVQY